MFLLDLPREIVDLVLEALVQDDIDEAFLARGACSKSKTCLSFNHTIIIVSNSYRVS